MKHKEIWKIYPLRISKELKKELAEEANKLDLSMAELIRNILKDYLGGI